MKLSLAFYHLALLYSIVSCTTQMPHEKGNFRSAELVELTQIDPSLKLDIRYATTNNFTGQRVYRQPRAFLQRAAAMALAQVNQKFKQLGYGLVIFDGYRPWQVTKRFWDITPIDKKKFVADPKKGSRHNRGCAVDLSLYDLKTGREIEMPSGYDEMTERAYPNYTGGTVTQRQMRDLLRAKMEAHGFAVYPYEWWHFDYKDWQQYPIINIPFEQIK
ncbi:M15 family metallopeptidase [Mucilaginibacter robiniae]|uniref:D-alanyl-D-alanine dipeptidase n=1 Tax=Mucilaginibacter robiniae TaxID=2728022 RepID=A0A7L5DW48_9SPHI|nr:M15 family metallopeptidase [Mucilaginibacter robiniae]QJD95315.1 M15 family metallopeptidase [Mucilaginibacter robiniae]